MSHEYKFVIIDVIKKFGIDVSYGYKFRIFGITK